MLNDENSELQSSARINVAAELYRTNREVACVVVICFGETKLSHAPRICQFVCKYHWISGNVTLSVDCRLYYVIRAMSHGLSNITKHKIYVAVRSLLFNGIILS